VPQSELRVNAPPMNRGLRAGLGHANASRASPIRAAGVRQRNLLSRIGGKAGGRPDQNYVSSPLAPGKGIVTSLLKVANICVGRRPA